METIKDLQDKLSLVLWVNRNLGKLCEVKQAEYENTVTLHMGHIAGYSESRNNPCVIVELFNNYDGWRELDRKDVIPVQSFDSSKYAYKLPSEISILV